MDLFHNDIDHFEVYVLHRDILMDLLYILSIYSDFVFDWSALYIFIL
jgi:hypothetical protein